MKNKFLLICLIGCSSLLIAQEYVTPPIKSTHGSVPVISDEAMEQCVKIYNEAKWLSEKLNNTHVINRSF